MDPMAVDMLGCLDGDQCSDKTQLADAVGAEVKEIIDYQAAEGPFPYSMSCVRDISVCLPFYSEVIQFPRYTLMVKKLSGDVGVRLLVRACAHWRKFNSDNMKYKGLASLDATIDPIGGVLWGLFGVSGLEPKLTFNLNPLDLS